MNGDRYDIVGGRVAGRRSASEITFFKNAGGGHFDLIACEAIHLQVTRDRTPPKPLAS